MNIFVLLRVDLCRKVKIQNRADQFWATAHIVNSFRKFMSKHPVGSMNIRPMKSVIYGTLPKNAIIVLRFLIFWAAYRDCRENDFISCLFQVCHTWDESQLPFDSSYEIATMAQVTWQFINTWMLSLICEHYGRPYTIRIPQFDRDCLIFENNEHIGLHWNILNFS